MTIYPHVYSSFHINSPFFLIFVLHLSFRISAKAIGKGSTLVEVLILSENSQSGRILGYIYIYILVLQQHQFFFG